MHETITTEDTIHAFEEIQATCDDGELNAGIAANVVRHIRDVIFCTEFGETEIDAVGIMFTWVVNQLEGFASDFGVIGAQAKDYRDELRELIEE